MIKYLFGIIRRKSLIGEIIELLVSSNNTIHIRYKEIIGNSHFINNTLAFSMELLRGRKRFYINSFYGHWLISTDINDVLEEIENN